MARRVPKILSCTDPRQTAAAVLPCTHVRQWPGRPTMILVVEDDRTAANLASIAC